MNHLLDDEDDLSGRADHRELTLSTSAVLAIFFGLAVLCALFLGLGYNLGRKSATPSLTAATDAEPAASTTTNFNSFKPAAGSPANTASPAAATTPPPATAAVAARPLSAPAAIDQTPSAKPIALQPPASVPAPPPAAPVSPASAAPAAGSFIVQVAAVSHQEDADLLVGALKGKGYAVAARSEPQDKLVHIQVGPFTNRKDAEAMRQRLLSDGYNAIVK